VTAAARRLGSALLLVVLLSMAGRAEAHVAIRLLITSPGEGDRVGADLVAEVYAQPFLGGADGTNFSVDLDGRPLDPGTGRHVSTPVETPIRVEETRSIQLHGLAEGEHTLTVTYRPDVDEAPEEASVTFVVEGSSPLLAGGIAAGAIAVAILGLWFLRSRRG
jgi:hypothetical protein